MVEAPAQALSLISEQKLRTTAGKFHLANSAVATRYDKTATSYLAVLHVAAMILWLR